MSEGWQTLYMHVREFKGGNLREPESNNYSLSMNF